MRILKLEEEFRVSVETFHAFFFENSSFKQRYHSSRGDSQIEIKQWTHISDGRFKREIGFFSQVSNNAAINRLVGQSARVKEIQYYKFTENGALNVTSETFFEGSPIGKSFTSESEWIVTPTHINKVPGCKVAISVKNNYGGTMFKSLIENWVHDTTEQSFKHWLTLVRSQVEEYEASENLKRVTPTPVKQQPPPPPPQSTQQPSPKLKQSSIKMQSLTNHVSDNEEDEDDLSEEEDNESIIDENAQHQHQHDSNSTHAHHHSHSIMDNESELSDFSQEFTDDEYEATTSNDEFFDTNEAWSESNLSGVNGKKEIKSYINNFQNELGSMKSILEVNHNRLLSLESTFSKLQLRGAGSALSNTTSFTPSGADLSTGGLGVYISRLEELVKNQQEDESKSKEKQKEYEDKLSELEKKINSLHSSTSTTHVYFTITGILIFLIGWPILARKIWSHLLPHILNLLKK